VSGDGAVAFVSQLRPGLPTTVVRNAIGLSALHALPAPTAGSALFVGELSQRKGVDVLLEALPGLPQHLERVVIVGDGQLTRGRGRSSALGESSLPRILGRPHALWTRSRVPASSWRRAARTRRRSSRRRRSPPVGPSCWARGVGNANDRRRLSPEAVNVMATASASELIGNVCKVLGRVVTPAARAAFTPSSCAEAFLKGTEIALPRETSVRQTVSERHRSRTK
jgi:hypothetical protein